MGADSADRIVDVVVTLLFNDPYTDMRVVVPWDVWPVVVTYEGPAGLDYRILTHDPRSRDVEKREVVRADNRCVVCDENSERFGCFSPQGMGCRGIVLTVRGFASLSDLSARCEVEYRAEYAEQKYGQVWSSRQLLAKTFEANNAVENDFTWCQVHPDDGPPRPTI